MLTEPVSITVLLALTIGIMQVFKTAFEIPDKFKPVMAALIGVVVTALAAQTTVFNVAMVRGLLLNGIMVGLMAVGLYDQKEIIGPEEE